MQFKTILSVLSLAMATSALPSPSTGTSSCNSPNVVSCCNAITKNGTGVGCIESTLNNILGGSTCTSNSALACCSGTQTALIAIECVPIIINV